MDENHHIVHTGDAFALGGYGGYLYVGKFG